MKILLIGGHSVEGFCTHIAETLDAMGHEAHVYEYFPMSRSGRLATRSRGLVHLAFLAARKKGGALARRMLRRLFETIRREGPFDLVLSVHDMLLPDEVEEIRQRAGARVVLWFPDPVANMGRSYFLRGTYDAVFLKEPYLVRLFRGMLGGAFHYLPECFNPRRHSAEGLTDSDRARYACDVCTAGSLYIYRSRLLENLASHDLKIWGFPPPAWVGAGSLKGAVTGRYVAYGEKAKAFLAARIVLNTLQPSEIWGTNVRTFEIAGAGGFQLCEWRPGIPQLFGVDREIVTFRTAAEMREKVASYLPRDEERARIAAAGRARALAEHTYEHRLKLLLATVFEGASGFPLPDLRPPA